MGLLFWGCCFGVIVLGMLCWGFCFGDVVVGLLFGDVVDEVVGEVVAVKVNQLVRLLLGG